MTDNVVNTNSTRTETNNLSHHFFNVRKSGLGAKTRKNDFTLPRTLLHSTSCIRAYHAHLEKRWSGSIRIVKAYFPTNTTDELGNTNVNRKKYKLRDRQLVVNYKEEVSSDENKLINKFSRN